MSRQIIHYAKIAHLLILLLLCMFCGGASGISIDNDIIGEPDIECLDQEIRVWIKTRKIFAGRIYAKGKSEDSDCSRDNFSKDRTDKPHFDLPLGTCGMKSLRSFDPRGMYYGITLVVSFHPLFITKVDQAFHVKCFFEEASRGLTAELGVSMIPTTEVNARHSIMSCSYSIHRSSIADLDAGRPAGTAIQFAKVGDKVLHQWHCEDPMFGILINNCYVTDGVNKKAQVIDARGCPMDPILITGIRYSSDLQRAYAESQVFKFADRPGVWFFCQIQMCMKKESMCQGITPPGCASTTRPPIDERGTMGNGRDRSATTRSGRGQSHGGGRREDGDNDENAAVESVSSVTKVLPANAESERADKIALNPARISTDKIPSEYENYEEPTPTSSKGASRDGSIRGGGANTRTPLTRPSLATRHQEHLSALDGYSQMLSPSAIEYDAENGGEEDAKSTVFGPGLSPSKSGSLSPGGRGFSVMQNSANENSGGGGGRDTAYDALKERNVIFENSSDDPNDSNRPDEGVIPPVQPPIGRDESEAPPGLGRVQPPGMPIGKRQETTATFETRDDLRGRGPPGSHRGHNDANVDEPTPADNREKPSGTLSRSSTRTTVGESPTAGTRRATTTAASLVLSGGKKGKDYVDYDDAGDVNIPSKLAELLAKLPSDEINADNLQRMFHDSVADRRALLHGFDALINKMRKEEPKADTAATPRHVSTPGDSDIPVITPVPFDASSAELNPRASTSKILSIAPTRRLHTAKMAPGTKIDTIHVAWDSPPNRLARDSPFPPIHAKKSEQSKSSKEVWGRKDKKPAEHRSSNSTIQQNANLSTRNSSADSGEITVDELHRQHTLLRYSAGGLSGDVLSGNGPNDPPMIAGQLLIYDLDETPPDEPHATQESQEPGVNPTNNPYLNNEASGECALTRYGLIVVGSTFSALVSALVIVVVALLMKTRKVVKKASATAVSFGHRIESDKERARRQMSNVYSNFANPIATSAANSPKFDAWRKPHAAAAGARDGGDDSASFKTFAVSDLHGQHHHRA